MCMVMKNSVYYDSSIVIQETHTFVLNKYNKTLILAYQYVRFLRASKLKDTVSNIIWKNVGS